MNRRALLMLLAITAGGTLLLVWLGGSAPAARASSLSREGGGVLAARRYLEETGTEVRLLDRPFAELTQREGVFVTLFPWQHGSASDDGDAIRNHVRGGGTLVLGYSGEAFGLSEQSLLESLSLSSSEARPRPPLNPLAWRRYVDETWELRPEDELTGTAALSVRAPRRLPAAPAGARVLHRGPGGAPAVFVARLGAGQVVVLPSEALANARLEGAGHAALLEWLRAQDERPWLVDEYHHGHVSPVATAATGPRRSLDLMIAHLLFVYGLLVLALAPRFGPAWREAPVIAGSTRGFLVSLGGLHARAAHHREAARLLVERAERWQPGRLTRQPEIDNPAALVGFARQIALRLRRRDS